MSNEPTLAYTVHHKGRKYRAGTTAEVIGPAAAEIGAHAWVGGVAPKKSQVPEQGAPNGGTPAGSPPVPTPSPLPTAGPGEQNAEPEGDSADDGTAPAKKPASGTRRGSHQD